MLLAQDGAGSGSHLAPKHGRQEKCLLYGLWLPDAADQNNGSGCGGKDGKVVRPAVHTCTCGRMDHGCGRSADDEAMEMLGGHGHCDAVALELPSAEKVSC
ncbi:unnamed protein product [Tetraodon nigroviridis]|uniref:(spotted green pufferfish) hypothetical protein n=1 Tax=Tetraodon nigroviridis TaxID=99883 RepID=Q4RW20_TETNG|nr:unnamed protein product [Tetraodon nigroviridis]